MRIASTSRGGAHAPELTRNALLFAYACGADAVRLPLRLTRDEKVVVFEDPTVERLTGRPEKVADLDLHELRALDIGGRFADGGGSTFRYAARAEPLGLLLDMLPSDLWLFFELKPEPTKERSELLAEQAATMVVHRRREQSVIVASSNASSITAFRKIAQNSLVAHLGPDQPALERVATAVRVGAHLVVMTASEVIEAGEPTPALARASRSFADRELAMGIWVDGAGAFDPATWRLAGGEQCIWAFAVDSAPEAAALSRPGWRWIEEDWPQRSRDGGDVNTDLWHLGYAKFNPEGYCHVYVDEGVHIDIRPFTGQVMYASRGDADQDEFEFLTERSWDAQKDWPFYSGGGVGLVPGVDGDFSAEVDIISTAAKQATTVEMAVVNVDPGPHRRPWMRDAKNDLVPNLPTSFRDRHTFFDPHGAPPFVGAEHDEDDGWRINWNLGTDYESNQYGHPAGDGGLLSGRLRLDRRGPYFTASYRAQGRSGVRDWICVGAVRNDSLRERVFIRLAGKRWRQEDPQHPTKWLPVIANHFTFKSFTLKRFL